MELRHLRCFLAVADELHLSRASKELEEDLGEQLFVRASLYSYRGET